MKRVVTDRGEDGRSSILIEESVSEGNGGARIWETAPGFPLGRNPDPNRPTLDFAKGQIEARYLELPTDAMMAEYLKAGIPGLDANGFHDTGTLDFLVLLEGRLVLELDDGSVDLSPGDVVVQRSTNHAWRNPGEGPAKCFVMISHPGLPS